MKLFILHWVRTIPFIFGLFFCLLSLCYLIQFLEYGLDFDDKDFWYFALLLFIGVPILISGIDLLSAERKRFGLLRHSSPGDR